MDQTIPAMMGETIHRAFRLALEPSLLVCHLYTALIYSIMYLWFEAFPILFQEIHGFALGPSGLPFLAFIVATLVIVSGRDSSPACDLLAKHPETVPGLLRLPSQVFPAATRKTSRHSSRGPARVGPHGRPLCSDCLVLVRMDRAREHPLVSTDNFLSFVCHIPTADHTFVSRIVPLIGASLYTAAIYILFQQILVYISLRSVLLLLGRREDTHELIRPNLRSYSQYAASILAGNTLFRSVTASVFPLFGHAFFTNLGMGPACSLLAGVSILMVVLIWLIMKNGDRLRRRSKFTA